MKYCLSVFLITVAFLSWTQENKLGSVEIQLIDVLSKEPVVGAQVSLLNTTHKCISDLDGLAKLENIHPGHYTLFIQAIEYPEKTIPSVHIKAGEITHLKFEMRPEDSSIVVVITKQRNLGNTTGATIIQRENNAVVEVISSDMIARTPVSNAGGVIKLTSGASIQDNKFAIIRGLNDRYNAAYLNGAPLPSSESDRKAFSFDMFPSNMLENLVISKSATSDQPAEFAGGIITINTKAIPEKSFISFALGSGYNTLTTFKTQTTYQGGSLDWLGIDNGSRALSSSIPAYGTYPTSMTEQATLAQQFSTSWALSTQHFSPNYNFQYSSGYSSKFGKEDKRQFGFVTALTYNRTFNLNETVRRGYSSGSSTTGKSQMDYDYLDKNNVESVLAGGLANFSLRFNENNSLSFQNIYSINSDDKLINRTGEINPLETNPMLLRSNARWFTSNSVYSGQLSGKHQLKNDKFGIQWLAAYSNVKRTTPSLNRSIYTRYKYINDPTDPNPADTQYVANISYTNVGPSYGGGMFFSKNNENSFNLKSDFTYDVLSADSVKLKLKAGVYAQIRNRNFEARQLGYTRYGVFGGDVTFNESLLYLPEDQIFDAANMGLIAPGVGGFKLTDGTKFSDAYQAQSYLNAAYVQVEQKFNQLALVYGIRTEDFQQHLQARRDNNTALEINTHKLDVLPAFNGIYDITTLQKVRLSYSQTLNRPEYRELAPFAFYDFTTNFVVSGNESLQRAKIHNADLRYEIYPGKGQLFSFTGFYKYFINPIEQVSRPDVTGEITFQNVPSATNYGFELEARSLISTLLKSDTNSLFNNLTVYGNIAIIRSKVDVSEVIGSSATSRPLQGQSPYVLNAGIQYKHPSNQWGMALNLNRVGQRIYIVGNVNEPDLWENARTFLDLQLTKSFWENRGEFKLNIQNILAQSQVFYQNNGLGTDQGFQGAMNAIFVGDKRNTTGYNADTDDQVWKTNFGRTISLSIAIKL
jgi:TonB-dependent receptor